MNGLPRSGDGSPEPSCVLLSGGVGGARMAAGLQEALPPGRLSVLGNTGDDFELLGLRVCPDLDTLLYTLAGRAHPDQGWGLQNETWQCMQALEELGAPCWFHLGDRDLATHLVRTEALKQGRSLTGVTADLARALGLKTRVLPMCDEAVGTRLRTREGLLDFQDYFVRRGQRDRVLEVEFAGIRQARATREVLEALAQAELVVLAPSNPFVSIAPILAVPGLGQALAQSAARKIAVSPIVGGRALKGPAAAMLESMGHEVSALGVARLYSGVVDEFVLDLEDEHLAPAVASLGMMPRVLPTVMSGPRERLALARALIRP